MMDSEAVSFIRREIARSLNIILSGASANATGQTEDIEQLYPGMPTISTRPTMHPYGYVSRAPKGTIQVTAKQGNTPENRLVIGHRDSARPACNSGEVVLYNQFGQQVRLNQGTIQLGGPDSAENIVLGQQLKTLLTDLINIVATIAGTSSAGFIALGLPPPPLPGPPATLAQAALDAAAAGANFVANDAILSDESFARKGGG